MKKLKIIAAWTILAGYLFLIPGFITERSEDNVIGSIDVRIIDSLQNRFITRADVFKLIQPEQRNILGNPDRDVNTDVIEKLILNHPVVKDVSVYKTASGVLHIDISQRRPLVRVINAWNEDYYIDGEGKIMPWSGRFTAFVPVANGDIRYRLTSGKEYDVRDSTFGILNELYKLGLFLKDHKFWGAQIEQIYVNNQHDIELIPRVGSQLIILGNMNDAEEKFKNLEAIYKRGFGELGWNGYYMINLKYKGQIICSKRNP